MRKKINRNAIVFKNRMDAKIKKIAKMRGGSPEEEYGFGLSDNQNNQNAIDPDSQTEQVMDIADNKAKEKIKG